MCVMEQVGVRELRQNLSVYLKRVRAGESLEVTEHGHPIAVLAPRGAAGERVRSHARGGPDPPRRPARSTDLPLPPGPVSTGGTEALAADREGKE